jgi:hypothetical protein
MKTKTRTTKGIAIAMTALALASASFAQQADKLPVPGTYYSAKDFEWSPPWPFNPHPELDAVEIGPGIFVFDDTAIPDTPEQAEARKRLAEAAAHAAAIAADPVLAKAAQEAAAKAQAELWERTRQRFLPTLHEPLTFRDGSPATSWGIVEGHRLLVAETLAEKQAEAEARRKEAEQWAKETGNPLRVPLEDGRAAYLEAVMDGLPVYKGTFNLNAARTLSTDRVRPGGDTGLNLTGTNTFFGMWDEGAVRTTHLEFGGRVVRMDAETNIHFHATGVAGTLAASGLFTVQVQQGTNIVFISNAMRGMAYQAPMGSWGFFSDNVEMRAAVVTNAIELSNHSYGLRSGWDLQTNNAWRWWGFPFIDPNQDPKFGQYNSVTREFDSITYDNPFYLTVWAAGNDQNEGPTTQPVAHITWGIVNNQVVEVLVTNVVRVLDGDVGASTQCRPKGQPRTSSRSVRFIPSPAATPIFRRWSWLHSVHADQLMTGVSSPMSSQTAFS